jgi:hypothetical protein
MTWEWVAGTVGAVGIVSTALTARGGRKHAETLSAERIKHERALAEDARLQARLADAYVEVLTIVNRFGHWADMVRPIVEANPPAPLPPVPDLEEQTRADALVMAYGSRKVEKLFEAWRQSVWDIIRANQEIELAQEMQTKHGSTGIDLLETWRRLADELKPAQRAARKAFSEEIAVELRSREPL